MKWMNLGIVVMIGGLLWLTPRLSRHTVPLGVSVPSNKTDHPVVEASLRRFRIGVAVATAVVAVASLLVGYDEQAGAIAPLVVVALGGLIYVWARRPIMQAKADEHWYADVPVRMRASVTAGDDGSWTSRVQIGWYVASVAILLVTAAVGAARYDDLPGRIPTHFSGWSTPDQYGSTSVLTVFGPLLIGLAVVVVMLGIIAVSYASPVRQYPDGDAGAGRVRALRMRELAARTIGLLCLLCNLIICGACVAIWFDVTSWALPPVLIVPLALMGVTIVWVVIAGMRLQTDTSPAAGDAVGPQSPDDDRYWKAGLFYVNRDDPALFVPKRQGIGWTVNLAHRGGQAFVAVTLLIAVAGAVAAAFLGG